MKSSLSILFLSILAMHGFSQPNSKKFNEGSSGYAPTEKTIFYKLGDRNIPIRVFQYGEVKNVICVSLHSNEITSVQAAMAVLSSKGGTLIKIENGDQRVIRFPFRGNIYEFDPNRIFSRIGIKETLEENGRSSPEAIDEIEKFTQRILILLPKKPSCIIALHNNTDEAYSVKSYLPGGERKYEAKAVYADSLQDADDIAYTTDSLLFQKMAKNRFNAIWQDNINACRDGSLSVYCGEKNIRYINIETEHGKLEQYADMLEKLLSILADENKSTDGFPRGVKQRPMD